MIALVTIIIMFLAPSKVLALEVIYIGGGSHIESRLSIPKRSIIERLGMDLSVNKNHQVSKTKNNLSFAPFQYVHELLSEKVMKWPTVNGAAAKSGEDDLAMNVAREVEITITTAGDVTLGGDDTYGHHGSFNQEAKNNGLSFFVKNIKDIFSKDDLTIVNLETTLTNATEKASKQFAFKGDPSYTEILTIGNIEAVNLANNHTYDYLQKGYDDTIQNLKNAGVGYFGYENQYMTKIKDIKIGAIGYKGWNDTATIRNQIKNDIKSLKDKGAKIVLVNFHWGQESSYTPNQVQNSLGRYTIDSGADLVVGHHPHVVQGIEEYKNKFIVYSLGNFMFGGNRNPKDKDTFVFQQTFHFKDGKLTNRREIKVIPFSISSVSHRNNFQPTPLTGTTAIALKEKVILLSNKISDTAWVQYVKFSD